MAPNPFYSNIFIDSCAFNPDESESGSAEEIFERYEKGELSLIVSHSNVKETEHPNTPSHIKAEASSKIFTIQTNLTSGEHDKFKEIWRILTGDGKPESMEQDSTHVFEAHKYGGYFVTTDKKIIKRRGDLQKICDARIVKPSELLELIKKYEASDF